MGTSKTTLIPNISMLLLALCPILAMYGTFLNYAILSLIFIVCCLIIKFNASNNYILPLGYDIYWFYLAIDYFVVTHKFGAVIPGGLSFFTFSVIVIFLAKRFDVERYNWYMKFLILITSVLFVGQEVMWYLTGSRFVPVLPLGELTTTMTYQGLLIRNSMMSRSASIFFEPSQYASFLLLGLLMEVYTYKGKRFLSKYAYLIILVLLFLRSGTGLVGLGVILLFKMKGYVQHFSHTRKIGVLVIMITVFLGAAYFYIGTKAGGEMYRRSQNELTLDAEGGSYVRFVQGSVIYSELPLINQIIGTSDEELLPIAKKYAYYFGYDTARDNILYMNGWAHVLCHTGLIGLILLIHVLYKLYRNSNDITKCGICLLVVLSFFEQTYCQPFMMVVLIMATYYQKKKRVKIAYG